MSAARTTDPQSLGPCPLCGREMVEGPSVDRHHWVPKSEGGRAADAMHTVCHRKIHSVLDERSLARGYDTPEKLCAHPEIARFLKWIAGKPATFTSRHRSARRR